MGELTINGLELVDKFHPNQIDDDTMHTALAGGSWCGAERQRGGGSGSVLM